MAPQLSLSQAERQVIEWMRRLSQQSREWRLVISPRYHKDGMRLRIEPTPCLEVAVRPDPFLAVE